MANTTNWTPVNTPVTAKQPNKKASSGCQSSNHERQGSPSTVGQPTDLAAKVTDQCE